MDYRIKKHPVLDIPEGKEITFYWNGKPLKGLEGEMISSALFANGIKIFGHHSKDKSPQGIFCANGQCSQCMVIANGVPVKSCMIPLKENMMIQSVEGLPELPEAAEKPNFNDIPEIETDVLIIGGGPAGLTASIELGNRNIKTILADDKDKLGGKLVLQTHKFFGSIKDCYAGTRGIDIAVKLSSEVQKQKSVDVWLNSAVLSVFMDKKIGILTEEGYKLVTPKIILNAAGAREKFLMFPGNTLPGVYGAGAFQTLVNRDLVKPTEKLFIVGGGNVGLIAGYHAIQAGIEVVGLAEALPQCGGYKVHADKLKRLGVKIYTSHTILAVNGKDEAESVTIAQVDDKFNVVPNTEKTFEVDTVLIAVGLSPVDEFTEQAELYGMKIYSAGDAEEIAEASAAMFSGKIKGTEIARALGKEENEIPKEWYEKMDTLKKPAGKTKEYKLPQKNEGIFPVFHCTQEIPCNPCTSVCPLNGIKIEEGLMGLPEYESPKQCLGCMKCVTICPGLAVTVVDYRKDNDNPIITLAFEIDQRTVKQGEKVKTTDVDGNYLADAEVIKVREVGNKTALVTLKTTKEIVKKIVGIRLYSPDKEEAPELYEDYIPDEAVVCRCERVTAGEIRKWIKKGVRDINQLKALTRASMGSCGSKTCKVLIERIYREEGITQGVEPHKRRPLFVEVPFGDFAGIKEKGAE